MRRRPGDRELVVEAAESGQSLAGVLRGRLGGSWTEARRLIESGKVFVGGARVERAGERVAAGQRIELKMAAPRPRQPDREVRIVHEDAQVVVIDKPPGVSTVPYELRERGTAMDLLRDAWRRQGKAATRAALHVVHRIDKDTSGLVIFAKTKRAEIALGAQFRGHTVERRYLCLAHGAVRFHRVESYLVRDRGDGLRGSAPEGQRGKRAVTHIEPLARFARATLCHVRLETGKTHQIRIHFAERGHPLVGESVYIRDYVARGQEPLPSARLMLHAELIGFVHPTTGETLHFESAAPGFSPEELVSLAGELTPPPGA